MPAGQPSARCAVTTIVLLLQLIPPSPLEGLGYLPSQAIYPVGMEQHALGEWGTSIFRSFTTLPGETKGSILQDSEKAKTKAHSSVLDLRGPERRRC